MGSRSIPSAQLAFLRSRVAERSLPLDEAEDWQGAAAKGRQRCRWLAAGASRAKAAFKGCWLGGGLPGARCRGDVRERRRVRRRGSLHAARARLWLKAECDALLTATETASRVRSGATRSETPGALSVGLACRLEQPCAPMASHGRVRMPVVGLGASAQSVCDELLLRAMELVDAQLPDLTSELFGSPLAPALRGDSGRAVCKEP